MKISTKVCTGTLYIAASLLQTTSPCDFTEFAASSLHQFRWLSDLTITVANATDVPLVVAKYDGLPVLHPGWNYYEGEYPYKKYELMWNRGVVIPAGEVATLKVRSLQRDKCTLVGIAEKTAGMNCFFGHNPLFVVSITEETMGCHMTVTREIPKNVTVAREKGRESDYFKLFKVEEK